MTYHKKKFVLLVTHNIASTFCAIQIMVQRSTAESLIDAVLRLKVRGRDLTRKSASLVDFFVVVVVLGDVAKKIAIGREDAPAIPSVLIAISVNPYILRWGLLHQG